MLGLKINLVGLKKLIGLACRLMRKLLMPQYFWLPLYSSVRVSGRSSHSTHLPETDPTTARFNWHLWRSTTGILFQDPTGVGRVSSVPSETWFKLTRPTLHLRISEILSESSISTKIWPKITLLFKIPPGYMENTLISR